MHISLRGFSTLNHTKTEGKYSRVYEAAALS